MRWPTLVVLAGLAAGCTSAGGSTSADSQPRQPAARTWADAIAGAKPAVVRVETTGCTGVAGGGSGFVVREGVITNAHVVRGAASVFVNITGGRRIQASVERVADADDLALLRAVGEFGVPLRFAAGERREGEEVVALGFPLGLPFTASRGSVSGLGRTVRQVDHSELHDLIQTDAAVNPGNSGGPLIGIDGRVQGVVTSGFLDANGIAFAVDAGSAQRFLSGPSSQPTPTRCDATDELATPTGANPGPATTPNRADPQSVGAQGADSRGEGGRMPVDASPGSVVLAFYGAINAGDYERAWRLGGRNLGSSFAEFRAGYARTLDSEVVIEATTGSAIDISLTATERSDKGVHTTTAWQGTYVVERGEIRSGTLRKVDRAPTPAEIVTAYYNAVNEGDFDTAWRLGGSNFGSRDRSKFEAGYAKTRRSDVVVLSQSANAVDVLILADEVAGDGKVTKVRYRGSYRVAKGILVSGRLRKDSHAVV